MSKQLILYRGDSTVIDEFKFKKTKSTCLVGQGIYLTNSEKIADTYRKKGNWSRKSHRVEVLFNESAFNRLDAYERAFMSFINVDGLPKFEDVNVYVLKVKIDNPKRHGELSKKEQKALQQYRALYDQLKDDEKITAEYTSTLKDSHGRRPIKVEYHHGEPTGYLSRFVFDEKEFNQSVFKIDQVYDPAFWELIWDNQIQFGRYRTVWPDSPIKDKDLFIKFNIEQADRNPLNKYFTTIYREIRHVLEPYGYNGFEYSGGIMMGGNRHRAFCIWDEQWVNKHLVEQIR